jgi:competence protein ComEA
MNPAMREALSRVVARTIGSPFAKPIARVILAAAGLMLLAFIGRTAVAGALAPAPPAPTTPETTTAAPGAVSAPGNGARSFQAVAALTAASAPPVALPAESRGLAPIATETSTSHSPASVEDPVVLNTAALEDLRRLPGIGPKRAAAILELRTHLGRFRAVEDLLKVKGIGRATLKRLRPLVRLDPPLSRDAGAAMPR